MRRIALLILVLSLSAHAGTVSRIYDFEPGTKIEADQVDAELDNILSTLNGNIDSDNLLNSGIATADIAYYSITKFRLDSMGQQLSSSSAVAELGSVTDTAVTNMTGTINVAHRPIWVGLQAAGGDATPGSVSYRNNGDGATANTAFISFLRDSVNLSKNAITSRNITSSTNDIYISLPCSAFWFIDTPARGLHTYTASYRVASSDSGVVRVENCKLVVFEM